MARAPRDGLTPARRKKCVSMYGALGVYAHVSEKLGISPRTLLRWRNEHPDFQAELDAVKKEMIERISEKCASRLEEYLDSIGTMQVVESKDTVTVKGEPYTEVRREIVRPIPAMLKFGLTKYHPDLVRVPLTQDEQDQVAKYISEVLAQRQDKKQGGRPLQRVA